MTLQRARYELDCANAPVEFPAPDPGDRRSWDWALIQY